MLLYAHVLIFVVAVTLGIHALVAVLCIPLLNLFCFLPYWPFCCLLKPFTCSWTQTSVLRWFLAPPVKKWNQPTWVQQGSSSISGRETRASRITPSTSWEWLASRLQRRLASWSSSGEAWPTPLSPWCHTVLQRNRWRSMSTWLCIWAVQPSG